MKFSELLSLLESEANGAQTGPSFLDLAEQAQAQLEAEIARTRTEMFAAVAEHERSLLAAVLRTS
ncbi:MAG: hypothetical protein DMF64_01630 [Acidobacteria bacterium]|nr:MAG: hypothetical protein DMF64_01630 [Acidobacteriota bacterium]